MTRLKKIKIKTLVAWSIFKDVQDQKHIINFRDVVGLTVPGYIVQSNHVSE